MRLVAHIVSLAAVAGWVWLILEVFTQPSFPEPGGALLSFFRATVVPIAGHMVMFGVLAGLMLLWTFAASLYRRSPNAALTAVLAATTAYGVAIELLQRAVPGRFASWEDVALDAVGAALVLSAGALVYARRQSRRACVRGRSPSA